MRPRSIDGSPHVVNVSDVSSRRKEHMEEGRKKRSLHAAILPQINAEITQIR